MSVVSQSGPNPTWSGGGKKCAARGRAADRSFAECVQAGSAGAGHSPRLVGSQRRRRRALPSDVWRGWLTTMTALRPKVASSAGACGLRASCGCARRTTTRLKSRSISDSASMTCSGRVTSRPGTGQGTCGACRSRNRAPSRAVWGRAVYLRGTPGRAGVVKLADARDSKSRDLRVVRVRPPPPAPQNAKEFNDLASR